MHDTKSSMTGKCSCRGADMTFVTPLCESCEISNPTWHQIISVATELMCDLKSHWREWTGSTKYDYKSTMHDDLKSWQRWTGSSLHDIKSCTPALFAQKIMNHCVDDVLDCYPSLPCVFAPTMKEAPLELKFVRVRPEIELKNWRLHCHVRLEIVSSCLDESTSPTFKVKNAILKCNQQRETTTRNRGGTIYSESVNARGGHDLKSCMTGNRVRLQIEHDVKSCDMKSCVTANWTWYILTTWNRSVQNTVCVRLCGYHHLSLPPI